MLSDTAMGTDAGVRAVTFTVLGQAAPKGSSKAFAFRRHDGTLGAAVTHDNPKTKGWQHAVTAAAQQQCPGVFFEGPVAIQVDFYLARPKSLPKRVRHHTKKPDLDKLARSVKDALKGVIWKDDSQVVRLIAHKSYAQGQPCAFVHVWPISEGLF